MKIFHVVVENLRISENEIFYEGYIKAKSLAEAKKIINLKYMYYAITIKEVKPMTPLQMKRSIEWRVKRGEF